MKRSYCIIFLILVCCTFTVTSIYIPPGPRFTCPEKPHSIYPCECLKESDAGIYVKCENSNLASISIGLVNLATHKVLIEELLLHKCHFDHLYGNLFYKTQVRILRIDDTPIKTINEHSFYGINNTLQELHITNSKLTEFPKVALRVLGNLTVLNIDVHRIKQLDLDIFADSLLPGKLEKLHLINGLLTELQFESFQPLRKLKTLDLHGNQLTALKRNQFKDLRDVEVLDISYNNITKLDSSHISDLTKLNWCNVSHNELSELTRGTFARNSVLRVLNMSHNKIKRLDVNSFRGMRFMRRLYLSDNAITDIGRGTFGSITRIGTIDLARNLLKKVDFQMFAQLNYVEIIDVSENNITEIQKQSFKDLYLTKINISHNAVSKIEANSFENCANMTLLDLSYNLIQDIPRYAFDSTTYALEFQLSYNQLTDMAQVPLHNMTGLKILNVSHNAITTIPKNTFPKLYELHTIDLSYNNISQIFNAVFQVLFSLRNLNLSHNSIEIIKPPTFGTLPTLLDLDLSNNKLTDIAKGGLTKLASLRTLTLENNMLEKIFTIPISLNHINLKNNWIMDIPEKTWPVMNALLSIDLTNNRLMDNLKTGSFTGLLTLQRLNLNSNGISRIPWESLTDMSTLQYLYLENNNLTELQKGAFGKLPVVFELNLHNNNISKVSQRAFDGLLQLITLNLSGNALRNIPNEAFVGLVSLRKLDLSHNFLEKIDNKTHGLLDDCLSLEMIDLSYNKISFVTRKTFPSNIYIPYRLKDINLSYNVMPVLTYDIVFGTKKVLSLNISHNNINDLRKGVLGNLTSLETLDLSYNLLTDLTTEPNIFNLPANITNLLINDNNLVKIPAEQIEKSKHLKWLDLSNNKFNIIDRKIIAQIKNGVDVDFEENPIRCDCSIRPLIHYLMSLPKTPQIYARVKCVSPQYMKDNTLMNVIDSYLSCVPGVNTTVPEGEEYDILPDLRFRHISYSKGILNIQWFVTATRDISDFYVNIRNAQNDIKFERSLSYDSRSIKISSLEIPTLTEGDKYYQVCVLARASSGVINGWFESQCKNLPFGLESVKNDYDERSNQVFTILSTNDRIKASTGYNTSAGIKIGSPFCISWIIFLIISI